MASFDDGIQKMQHEGNHFASWLVCQRSARRTNNFSHALFLWRLYIEADDSVNLQNQTPSFYNLPSSNQ